MEVLGCYCSRNPTPLDLQLVAPSRSYVVTRGRQTNLLSACREHDWESVMQFIQDGHDVNTSNEHGTTPLMWAAHSGNDQVVDELIRAGARVDVESKAQQIALHWASCSGHSNVVKTLIKAGANINGQDLWGETPLMMAAEEGKDQVVVELIRGGARMNVITSHEWWEGLASGSTALHSAAKYNHIECGVHLVEAGADMTARNKDSKSPLDLASVLGNFRRTIRQARCFSIKRIVAVIGNAEHGKSTLIAALQAEGNSLLKRFINRFTQVQDIRQRTTGIEAVQFSSRKYGQTLFYDFAGQADYHGPHQAFMEAILSNPGVSVTLLLLVKATDEEDIITRQVTRWLQPLALTSTPSTLQVILIGSFLDEVKSREEAKKKLLQCTQSVQVELPFNIHGPFLLDCRKPESEGIRQICSHFQKNQPLPLSSDTIPYSLHWIMKEMQSTEFSAPAITLHTFQSWLQDEAKLVLLNFPPPEQICHDLTAVGHALFLPNEEDPSQSWLIVDLQGILHNVYGTLFSGSQGKVNQFGLLHCSQLAELFPSLDLTMIQEVLISLEFCIRADPLLMREELQKLTANDELKGEGWLYFPALVSAQPPDLFPNDPDPQHLQWVCWQVRTEKKHCISAHLLQSIILRLAANHVFTHELPSVREHCCSVWVNGLSWISTTGVDVVVQISDCSVVQVVGCSEVGPEKLNQYVSTVVRDVIKTTTQLSPKLMATSYIVHPYTPTMWKDLKIPPPDSLYPISSIVRCINDGKNHVLSRKQSGCHPCGMSLTGLFGGWSPSLSVVQDMDFKRQPQYVLLSSTSQSGATTAVKGPSTEMEVLTTTQQAEVSPEGEPFPPQDGWSHPVRKAVQVLDQTRDQFIEEIDANSVVWELHHRGCISDGDVNKITHIYEPTQQNQFLHRTLVQKCTEETFETVCDIIIAVKGNPKMTALGKTMKKKLASFCSDLPSVPSSSSSQSGATAAIKGPSAEMGVLTTTQQDGHTYFGIDSTPTLQAIRKFIVSKVAANWSILGICLGLESSVIMMARADQCGHACTAIFERWLSWEPGTGEKERTWRTVLSAVEDAGHRAFSQQLKTEMFRLL